MWSPNRNTSRGPEREHPAGDGFPATGMINIGPYSVLIFSQDNKL